MPRSLPTQPSQPSLDSLFPGCMAVAGDLASALPLEHTFVRAEITGLLASVTVTQQFSNPLNEPAELIYLFPLPHSAALIGFEIHIGSREIQGELHEVGTARQEYEEAVRQGQQAGLAEQRMEGLYSVSLAHVRPGEAVSAVFHYQERIKFDDNVYEFIFPMGLTPKYHSPDHPEEGDGVDAPIATPGERIGDVQIEVHLLPGLPLGQPVSPSHSLQVEALPDGGLKIRLQKPALPDHDFVLRLPVAVQEAVLQAWRAAGQNGDYFLALLQPPDLRQGTANPPPRQFIFVLDRSGSMGGQPIAQARNALRACLRTLNPQDEFAIQLFDNVVEWYQPRFSPVTQAEIDKADQFLAAVEGRGGTEIIGALQAAFTFSRQPEGRLRYIVFLTDGAVSATERALAEISRKLGKARLFVFGIGPSVNRPLLSRMAAMGRGTSEFLQLDEDIEGAIIRFQDRLAFPALTDLTLTVENATLWDVLPSPLPDAYVGQPVVVLGRLKQSAEVAPRLVLRGIRDGQKLEIPFILPAATENSAVRRAWGQARLDALLEQAAQEGASTNRLRNEIISHALDYGLASPETAFIAIDRDSAVADGEPRRVRVSQPLPQGLDLAGFTGRAGGIMPIRLGMQAPDAFQMMEPQVHAAGRPKSFIQEMSASDFDIPSFMRLSGVEVPAAPETLLRNLARSQKLNGSWEDDVEHTASALLYFVRNGHSSTRGSFRVVVQRAVEWLLHQQGSGLAELARLVALAEQKTAAGDASAEETAVWAQAELGISTAPEDAALLPRLLAHEAVVQSPRITSADELRLAALAGQRLPLDKRAERWFSGEWGKVWKALVTG